MSLTIKEIEKKLAKITDDKDPFIASLREDERIGVQKLLINWRKKESGSKRKKTGLNR